MDEAVDEALGTLRGAVEEIEAIGQRLHTRMLSDDIPWGAGSDISAEFNDDIDRLAKDLAKAEKVLSAALTPQEPSK